MWHSLLSILYFRTNSDREMLQLFKSPCRISSGRLRTEVDWHFNFSGDEPFPRDTESGRRKPNNRYMAWRVSMMMPMQMKMLTSTTSFGGPILLFMHLNCSSQAISVCSFCEDRLRTWVKRLNSRPCCDESFFVLVYIWTGYLWRNNWDGNHATSLRGICTWNSRNLSAFLCSRAASKTKIHVTKIIV